MNDRLKLKSINKKLFFYKFSPKKKFETNKNLLNFRDQELIFSFLKMETFFFQIILSISKEIEPNSLFCELFIFDLFYFLFEEIQFLFPL